MDLHNQYVSFFIIHLFTRAYIVWVISPPPLEMHLAAGVSLYRFVCVCEREIERQRVRDRDRVGREGRRKGEREKERAREREREREGLADPGWP
jgi:hypothetical protein